MEFLDRAEEGTTHMYIANSKEKKKRKKKAKGGVPPTAVRASESKFLCLFHFI